MEKKNSDRCHRIGFLVANFCLMLLLIVLVGCGVLSDSDPGSASALAGVIESEACPDTYRDNFSLVWESDIWESEIKLDGTKLSFYVDFGGGCGPHDFLLKYVREDTNLIVSVCHNGHGDNCKALLLQKLEFDLTQALSQTGAQNVILEAEDGTRQLIQ